MDLSNIEMLALAQTDTTVKRTSTTEGGNYAGSCPVCGDKDDFIVLPEHTGNDGRRRGQAFCRECHPQRMDAVDYLMWARKMDYKEALLYLHEQYSLDLPENFNKPGAWLAKSTKPAQPQYRIKPIPMTAEAPSKPWQERGLEAVKKAQEILWHPQYGKEAREYLHSRGLTDETIKTEGLGLVYEDTYDDPLKWGLNPDDVEKVYVPRGIIFPYTYKGELWKLRVRRIDKNIAKDRRYMMISGSSNGLYRADKVQHGLAVAVFEGEIDALGCAQAADDERIACVAIGSNAHARIPKWVILLSRASQVLRCFDPDNAGADAHKYWSERLKNSKLLSVVDGRHDANEMLTHGDDVAGWLMSGIVDTETVSGLNDTTFETPSFTTLTPLTHGCRVTTPEGPGRLWEYTPLDEQIRRNRLAVALDKAIHSSGRTVEYFYPSEVVALAS